jgi:hypothetical protein
MRAISAGNVRQRFVITRHIAIKRPKRRFGAGSAVGLKKFFFGKKRLLSMFSADYMGPDGPHSHKKNVHIFKTLFIFIVHSQFL